MRCTTLYLNLLLLSAIAAGVVVAALLIEGLPGEAKAGIIGSFIGGVIGFGKDILAKDSEPG